MILHFAKENDFKVSLISRLASERAGAREAPQGLAGSCVWSTCAPCSGLPLPLPGFCCLQIGPDWWGLLGVTATREGEGEHPSIGGGCRGLRTEWLVPFSVFGDL